MKHQLLMISCCLMLAVASAHADESTLVTPVKKAEPAQDLVQKPAQTSDCFPFVGERMKFDVGWEFVTAGEASIAITAKGESGYQIHNFARTNGFFDMFKRVRDTLISEGVCLGHTMQSTLFTTDQQERKYIAKKHVSYLWQENKVVYTKNEKTKVFDVPAGHLNVLDAFYLTRIDPPTKDKPLSIPIFDAGETYNVTVRYVKHQKLRAPWGKRVDCIVIRPELETEGVFTSVGVIKIWLTDDERRIPLKITAKIALGSIIVRMTGYSI